MMPGVSDKRWLKTATAFVSEINWKNSGKKRKRVRTVARRFNYVRAEFPTAFTFAFLLLEELDQAWASKSELQYQYVAHKRRTQQGVRNLKVQGGAFL